MRFGLACRDCANRIVTVGITHHQQSSESIHAHGDKPLFLVIPIFNRDRIQVIKNTFNIGKVYPMFGDIGPILGEIKGEIHTGSMHTICICCKPMLVLSTYPYIEEAIQFHLENMKAGGLQIPQPASIC